MNSVQDSGSVACGSALPWKMRYEDLKSVIGLTGPRNIAGEEYREYVWLSNPHEPYRINRPVALYYREGGSTHRVVDETGMCHCVPFGVGTVVRWVNRDRTSPVTF